LTSFIIVSSECRGIDRNLDGIWFWILKAKLFDLRTLTKSNTNLARDIIEQKLTLSNMNKLNRGMLIIRSEDWLTNVFDHLKWP
jgi:hypothetical protein